jgi:hypothetical protein
LGAFWLASHWLLVRDPRGGIATAVAGSAMVYLGMLDAACISGMVNIRVRFRGRFDAVVNAACLLFGCVNIWYAATRRKEVTWLR